MKETKKVKITTDKLSTTIFEKIYDLQGKEVLKSLKKLAKAT